MREGECRQRQIKKKKKKKKKKRGKNRDRLAGVNAILDNRDQDEGVKRKCGLVSSPGSLSDR